MLAGTQVVGLCDPRSVTALPSRSDQHTRQSKDENPTRAMGLLYDASHRPTNRILDADYESYFREMVGLLTSSVPFHVTKKLSVMLTVFSGKCSSSVQYTLTRY